MQRKVEHNLDVPLLHLSQLVDHISKMPKIPFHGSILKPTLELSLEKDFLQVWFGSLVKAVNKLKEQVSETRPTMEELIRASCAGVGGGLAWVLC